ncbi:3-phosphoshikimate 1-carboxyvinyltransferase [Clostridium sp.]|uniref:3-phosphoshikimate 1-carboxyvinyltransferase n=1 Tax=Clostridium sp. TaxID=1506 RepID=UPI001A43AF2C|nr:3-phosphoshikimate 1-carboxyvinyltransferase [Clostridium sp.]MBK5242857.1 3-phosphoshikimate 1-carboxyvinyltransferase [Clostridium sp.]
MTNIKITPSILQGKILVPPSKSLCHRAVIAAGLSSENCNIENIVFSEDILATCNAMKDLGVSVTKGRNNVIINGNNFLNITQNEIDCAESGSTLRFLIPIALLTGSEFTFTGSGRLVARPLTPYYKIFKEQDIKYSPSEGLPLTIQGKLKAGVYKLPGNISSQFITGLLFALPLLNGDSKIIVTTELESKAYVDLTIDILSKFSVHIENIGYKEINIVGNQKYIARNYRVEGDFSQAAFWIVAGILGGDIQCEDMNINSLQGDKAIVDIIMKMGGNISIEEGRIKAKKSKTHGIIIDASECPDLVPILAVLASLSHGTTEIINAGRLRIKECDRLKAMATELTKLGGDVVETEDGLIIHGKESLEGGTVDSYNDHRIAMALSIASIRSNGPVIINDSACIKKSYPGFYKDFVMLGGKINEWSLGQ